MRESVVSASVLQVLACILIMVELHAAIPRVYRPILSFGDIIDGSHRARENHYKFERRLIIGHNHPYNQYSNMKMFWPEEGSSHTTRDRITFFKCINRTPNTVKTWMHVIRGGMGSPEVVVDVRYAPIQFMLLNIMIITCDIYTETSDIVTKEEHFFWNPFHIETSNTPIEPVTDRTSLLIPNSFPNTSETICSKETSSPVHIKPTTITITSNSSEDTTGYYHEGISEVTDKTPVLFKRTGLKTDRDTVLIQKKDNETSETNICINGSCVNIKGEAPQGTRIRTLNLDAEEAYLETGNMTLEVTADESFHKAIKCPKLGKITLHIQDEASGAEQIIEILCGGTSDVTSLPIGTTRSTLGEYSTDNQASKIVPSGRTTDPSTTWTTLQALSSETAKIASQKGVTSSITDTPSSSMNVPSIQTEEPIEIESENTSPGTDVTNHNTIRTNVFDEQDEHSNTERPIEKVTMPLTYNFIIKIVPEGIKKKIGLAKITYR